MGLTTPGRLWLTQGGDRLVPDGDPDAATLYCSDGDQVDDQDLTRLGWKQRKATPQTKDIVGGPDKADDDGGKPSPRGGRARK